MHLRKGYQTMTTQPVSTNQPVAIPAMTDERLMDAAEKIADRYEGDDRQDIKTDVMNAFYAGAAFASQPSAQPSDTPYGYIAAKDHKRLERLRTTAHDPADCHVNVYVGKGEDNDIAVYLAPQVAQPSAEAVPNISVGVDATSEGACVTVIHRAASIDHVIYSKFTAANTGETIDTAEMVKRHIASQASSQPIEARETVAGAQGDVLRVDYLGLALELESAAKKVESNTARRAMEAGAHGLRLALASAQPIEQKPIVLARIIVERDDTHAFGKFARIEKTAAMYDLPVGDYPLYAAPQRSTTDSDVRDAVNAALEQAAKITEAITIDESIRFYAPNGGFDDVKAAASSIRALKLAPPATEALQSSPSTGQAATVLTLANAPIGTIAPSISGGHWTRVDRGWKWCTGATFPRPGGDWNGELIAPQSTGQAGERE
jgi:hypothetical protein